MKDTIISHVRPADMEVQTNEAHSLGVAQLAKDFAAEFGMGDWGWMLGLLHDKGKELESFQKYIRKVTGLESDADWNGEDKQHAFVGAVMAISLMPTLYPLASYPILGHHAGLCDYTDFDGYINKDIPSEVNFMIELPQCKLEFFKKHDLFQPNRMKYIHHVERMLFSCLVDADFLKTEGFMQPEKAEYRKIAISLEDLLPKLESNLSTINQGKDSNSNVNIIRRKVQNQCRLTSEKPQGVYSLTVPTGGGKTLSSLLWAMLHAIKNNKRRIIIAIPYTSIISQTASILKDIFGNDAVLEHHSNYDYKEDEYSDDEYNPERLASENWDAPIVITTNVQLFESMYASHPGKCRKLHNIANSVIILDEVQTLPGKYLQAIVDALKAYNELFGVSLLFTTASQPTLEGERKGQEENLIGFDKIEELIPAEWKLHEALRRVELVIEENTSTLQELADRIMTYDRVLCIVNTRNIASKLYSLLPQADYHYHLSRNMCAEHVDATLSVIKNRLEDNNDNNPIRVVTTQLVEAGVDIDFPIVMRQEIGLDSILQAAGRCNREGKMKMGTTYVFKIEGGKIPNGTMSDANNARLNMNDDVKDLFSPEAMIEYFSQYYSSLIFDVKKKEFDYENITTLLHDVNEWRFDTADKYFQLIDDGSFPVIVNFNDSNLLVEKLRNGNTSAKIYRRLGRFTVNIPKYIFDNLSKSGIIEQVKIKGKDSGLYYASNHKQYDSHLGMLMENLYKDETLIV